MKNIKRIRIILMIFIAVLILAVSGTQKVLAANHLVIVIDPGHGGPGTTDVSQLGANYNGIQEKVANLITAQALYNELSQYGNCTVYLTRNDDRVMSISDRVNYAQSVGANVMISVHYNASSEHLYYGGEIFVQSRGQGYATGYGLGSCIMEQWVANGAQNKGIKTRLGSNGDYYGINRMGAAAGIPAIIIEHGYIDNANDFSRVGNQDAWTRMGILDATGIAKYYGLQKGVEVAQITPTVNIQVPSGVVRDDITPPTNVVLTVNSYDKTTGTVNYTLSAVESESKVMYYAVTSSNAPNITEIKLWNGGEAISGTLMVPIDFSGTITARVYNNFELSTDSAPVSVLNPVPAPTVSPNAVQSEPPTPAPTVSPNAVQSEPPATVSASEVLSEEPTPTTEEPTVETTVSESEVMATCSTNAVVPATAPSTVSEAATETIASNVESISTNQIDGGDVLMNIATIAGLVISVSILVVLFALPKKLNRHMKLFLWSLFLVIALGTLTIFIIQSMKKNQAKIAGESISDTTISSDGSGAVTENVIVTIGAVSTNDAVSDSIVEESLPPLAENEYRIETASENQIEITFAGDVLLDPGYAVYNNYKNSGYEVANCISPDLLMEMQNADIMMVNNEFPYSLGGSPLEGKTYTFRANPNSVSVLEDMGVDVVSIANNHAFDYGETAFLDTLTTLEDAGMPYVGGGRNIEDACQPIYYISGDTKIALIAATQIERFSTPDTRGATETAPGVFRCYDDPTVLLETIKEAKQNSDFVILYVHWGTENTDVLDWCQTSQAPLFVEAGVDLIIGDHPHCLQEVGYIDGVPIVYSLSNFWFNSKTVDSCIVKATITNGELTSLQFVPCLQSGCTAQMLAGEEKMRVINYMRSISTTAQMDDNGYITPISTEG